MATSLVRCETFDSTSKRNLVSSSSSFIQTTGLHITQALGTVGHYLRGKMLNLRLQQMLKEATSETLEPVTKQIKEEGPELFHIETGANETLSTWTFLLEPTNALPMKGFVRACEEVPKAAVAA